METSKKEIRPKEKNFTVFDSQIELLKRKKEYVKSYTSSINLEETWLIHVLDTLPWYPELNEKTGKYEIKKGAYNSRDTLQATGYKVKWIGGVKSEIPEEHQEEIRELLREMNCFPVFLSSEEIKLGLHGFANQIIWPMLHYQDPSFIDVNANFIDREEKRWRTYQAVNHKMADKVLSVVDNLVSKSKDVNYLIWVHDYQLMLTPQYIRKMNYEAKIGFFFYPPFPSTEIFKMCQYRSELLQGMLGSNLIGFNGYDYVRHFSNSCRQVLGLESSSEGVDALKIGGCFCKIGAYPISIDTEKFDQLMDDLDVQDEIEDLKDKFGGRKIILGVDKLDTGFGILHKLAAFELFLKKNPDMRDKVVLVQIVTDPKEGLDSSQLRSDIYETVSKINGLYGSFGKMPIQHLDKRISLEKLVALYGASECLMITSLRGGINLIPFEFTICQQKNHGSVLLSEFTGTAFCFGAGAFIVNPWDVRDTAKAIGNMLKLSDKEKKEKYDFNYQYVSTHSAHDWTSMILNDIENSILEMKGLRATIPEKIDVDAVLESFKNKKKKLLIFSVLDVLTQQMKHTNCYQFHNLIKVDPKIREAIEKLAEDKDVTIVISSRIERKYMEKFFNGLPVWIISDNGFYYKWGKDSEWKQLNEHPDLSWREDVYTLMNQYEETTPGSFVVGNTGDAVILSWYQSEKQSQNAISGFQSTQIHDFIVHLWAEPLTGASAEVILGTDHLEVRPTKTSPLLAVERIMEETKEDIKNYDFVLCLGEFLGKDEEIYNYLYSHGAFNVSASGSTGKSVEQDKTAQDTITEKLNELRFERTKLDRVYSNKDLSAYVSKKEKGDDIKVEKTDVDLYLCTLYRDLSLADYYTDNAKNLILKIAGI